MLGIAACRESNATEWKLNLHQCDVTETRHSFDYTLKKASKRSVDLFVQLDLFIFLQKASGE